MRLVPDAHVGSTHLDHEVEQEEMKLLSADLHKCQYDHEEQEWNAGEQEECEVDGLEQNKENHQCKEQDDELPHGDGPDNLRFFINKLWDDEAIIHITNSPSYDACAAVHLLP